MVLRDPAWLIVELAIGIVKPQCSVQIDERLVQIPVESGLKFITIGRIRYKLCVVHDCWELTTADNMEPSEK